MKFKIIKSVLAVMAVFSVISFSSCSPKGETDLDVSDDTSHDIIDTQDFLTDVGESGTVDINGTENSQESTNETEKQSTSEKEEKESKTEGSKTEETQAKSTNEKPEETKQNENGNPQKPNQTPQNQSKGFSESDFYCTIKGQTVKPNMDFTKLNLGSYIDVQEAPSCHFDGMDKIFYYDGLIIYTYKNQSQQIIYDIEITGKNISTPKGIKVGMSADDAIAAYGEGYASYSTGLLRYSLSGGRYFDLALDENKNIISIEYLVE